MNKEKLQKLQKKVELAGATIDKNGIDLILSWTKGNMINYSQSGYGSIHFDNGRQVLSKYIDHLSEIEESDEKKYIELENFCTKVLKGEDNIKVPFVVCI